MTPGHEQGDLGEGHLMVGQVHAGQMALQVVDAHHGDAPTQGERLGGGDADQERAHQTRPGGDRNSGQVAAGDSGLGEGPLDNRRHRFEVGAAGQLRDDPTERGVQVDLACDHRRAHR